MSDTDPYIAVVDDEPPVRTMLGRLLRLAHYEVGAFASGEEFLASIVARRPACAILDVHMPGLSGFDVQERLRAGSPGIPVVFITASDEVGLARTALESGAIGLLRKPFSNLDLLEAVGRALASPAAGT